MAEESKRDWLLSTKTQLKTDASSWLPMWRDLDEYLVPGRGRFDVSDHNQGKQRRRKIVNGWGSMAHRTLKAGMHAGITNPARPWFELGTPDPELNGYAPVKRWLDLVQRRMRWMFLRSNVYSSLPTVYGDIGGFGTAAMAIVADPQQIMRTYTFPIGSYYLATDGRNRVDTFVRDFKLSVRQVVDRFGRYDPRTGKPKWDNISTRVKNLYDQGNYNQTIDLMHWVGPNPEFDPRKAAAKFMRYGSIYMELGTAEGKLLSESGYKSFPFVCPRWEAVGEDVYGSECPGMVALGDTKSLQLEERRKALAIEKMADPPMIGPPALATAKVSTIPGSITIVNQREGQKGFSPAYQVDPRINELMLDIQEHQRRISRAFFEDLFLMMANTDRRDVTAREVQERHEEKLLMLGPVLERSNDELHDPLIDRAFQLMLDRSGTDGDLIPPPPDELQGQELRVEYISIMAQAQKMIGSASVERFVSFVGNLAAVDPGVLDKANLDSAVDVYHDQTGVAASLLRTDQEAAERREARAQAEAQQRQVEMAQQAAQGAKTLSETDTEGDNALTALLRAQGMA